ncbi:hypothetical protein ISCGN_018113 [Ixodes scapularis]
MVRQRHGAESISVEEEDAPNKVLCVESTAMTEKGASKFFSTPKTGWFTLEHTAYIVCFGFLLTILLLGILWVIEVGAPRTSVDPAAYRARPILDPEVMTLRSNCVAYQLCLVARRVSATVPAVPFFNPVTRWIAGGDGVFSAVVHGLRQESCKRFEHADCRL